MHLWPPLPAPSDRPGPGSGSGGHRGLLLALGACLAVPLLSGCATKGDMRDLQSEVRRLYERQDSILMRLEALTRANRDSILTMSDVVFDLRGDLGQQLGEIRNQLVTLQELTGQNQRSLAALRDQVEARTRLAPPSQPATDTMSEGGGGGPSEGRTTGGAEDLYNAGITQFNRGSFLTARRAFERFLETYPTHALAPDAHFYLAQTLVQEGRFQEAVQEFQRVPEMFPGSPRVPQALYRIGILYLEELDDTAEARRYLERVVNSYPDSGVAELAQQRLREIG